MEKNPTCFINLLMMLFGEEYCNIRSLKTNIVALLKVFGPVGKCYRNKPKMTSLNSININNNCNIKKWGSLDGQRCFYDPVQNTVEFIKFQLL